MTIILLPNIIDIVFHHGAGILFSLKSYYLVNVEVRRSEVTSCEKNRSNRSNHAPLNHLRVLTAIYCIA